MKYNLRLGTFYSHLGSSLMPALWLGEEETCPSMSVLQSMLNAVQPVDTLRRVALRYLPVVHLPRGSRNVLTRSILEHVHIVDDPAGHYQLMGEFISLLAIQGCMRKHGLAAECPLPKKVFGCRIATNRLPNSSKIQNLDWGQLNFRITRFVKKSTVKKNKKLYI